MSSSLFPLSNTNENKELPTNFFKSFKITCTFCNRHFQWKSGLSRHIKLFHIQNKDKNYKCKICSQVFYKKVGLSMHLKQHSYKVMPANSRTMTNLLLQKTHQNETEIFTNKNQKISHLYSNIITETVYSSDSDCEYEILQTATKLNNPDDKSKHKCQFCEKNFVKLNSLHQHLKRHDQKEAQSIRNFDSNNGNMLPNISDKTDSEMDTDRRVFPCNKCNKTFKRACNLTNHLKLHLKQSIVARKELTGNLMIGIKPRYSCSFCRKIYLKKVHLDNHLAMHIRNEEQETEKQPCSDCNKEFGVRAMEINKQTHTAAQPHLCMVCGKSYSRSGYLSLHMRTHSNYRPHLCSVCGKLSYRKSFTIKRYLLVHSRIHNQERPFTCQHCNKSFIQKGNLTEHLRIHSGDKPHICAVCGKRFTHYSGLTQHLLTHNPEKKHSCKICGKAFRQGGHYREHMRIHSGDRPFICNICNRAFASSSSLVVHSRTHSGERPYKCLVCKKGFIKSHGLKQHKKTHTACNIPNSIT